MCVHMYVHMYVGGRDVCMHVCINLCMYVCIKTCISIYICGVVFLATHSECGVVAVGLPKIPLGTPWADETIAGIQLCSCAASYTVP